MISNILVLLLNDLAFSFKNKTFYLILFIPLFVFGTLHLVDKTGTNANLVKIGLIHNYPYAPEIIQSITAAETRITITWINNEAEGRDLLQKRRLDGVLIGNETAPQGLELLVLKTGSVQTSAILQHFSALQKVAQGNPPDWIATVEALHQGDARREMLPTWVLMLVMLTGFMILPMQVAEEKEKKLLLALLQTPIHEIQWLVAKLLLGIILISTSVLVLHLLGQFGPVQMLDYLLFILAGSYCFSAYGIFLGFLCRTQASARTLGVIFFLPHLLPSAMAGMSEKLTTIAPLLPSYQLFHPLQSILLEGGRAIDLSFDLCYLIVLGTAFLFLTYLLIKRRWLM